MATSADENHTGADGTKPRTAIEAVTDPDFLPSLDGSAYTAQHAKSHLLLLSLIVGGM
jgi:hypothetical protein